MQETKMRSVAKTEAKSAVKQHEKSMHKMAGGGTVRGMGAMNATKKARLSKLSRNG